MAKRVFRSKKKLSGTRASYRPWRDWEVGDVLIGTYITQKTDNFDKPNWLVKVEDAQFAKVKEGKKLVGLVIGLNSSGKLDKAMEGVSEGDMIQVTYNGLSEIESGKYKGKEAHDIEVDLVEEADGATGGEEEHEEDDGEAVDL